MMDDKLIDDELERRLGDLFGGPGLDLTPGPAATTSVLARVRRRRRRRRAIQLSAPAVAVLGVIGAVLTAQGSSDRGMAPIPAVRPTATATTVPPEPGELAMTATSVGALRLGMSVAQAEATGLLDPSSRMPSPRNPDCLWYSGLNVELSVSVGKLGVSRIRVNPFIHTPQGVAVGDPYRKAQGVYPSLPVTPDRRESYRVPAPGGTGTWYIFDLEPTSKSPTGQTRIQSLVLSNDDPTCT